jgi:hypothetical protein
LHRTHDSQESDDGSRHPIRAGDLIAIGAVFSLIGAFLASYNKPMTAQLCPNEEIARLQPDSELINPAL